MRAVGRPGGRAVGALGLTLASSALLPHVALAHDGRPLLPHDLWSAWSFEPGVIVGLVLTGVLYLTGARALWQSAGVGRGVRRWEAGAFAAGWLMIALALVSPLHELGGVLFSAHMVQHELLMAVAAPLLVLGRPVVVWLWALPLSWRKRLGGWAAVAPVKRTWGVLTLPLVAWTIHAAAIWLWHIPRLFQATLDSELVHTLQHLSFLGSALLFWWTLLQIRDGRLGRPVAVIYLFTTAVHTSLLGAILTFSSRVWYPLYDSTASWGLTPLEDQQLAGLIMWVPAGLAYLIAALAITATWLQEPEPRRLASARRVLRLVPVILACVIIGSCRRGTAMSPVAAAQVTGGSPSRGELAIRHFGCGACHTIPGIPGAKATVGPPLSGIGGRPYVAGVLTNTPTNLIHWIHHPQEIDSLTAMPDVGLSETDARDIASYLYTLK
jgi:putative membrane protein